MVELDGIRYDAGGRAILRGVSLRFEPARFNVILGANGAGKSTLLRIAAGLLHSTAGTVRYDGRSIADIPSRVLARRRAVLSQHVELAFPLPVREVALMGRYPHYGRVPTAHDLAIVDQALEMVGMTSRADQPYPTLSGGEQQKVQMARVLAQIWMDGGAREPTYLFLDEPTTSLDVHYQIALLDIARGLLRTGCTVIAILHDINLAGEYGDRFFLLEGGALVYEGDGAHLLPAELLERTFGVRARFVADPVGGGFWRFTL